MGDEASLHGVALVIEDDAAVAALLCKALADLGYATVACRDADEALLRVRAARPAALLLDARLPGMDGWEFARRLRLAFGEAIPIVVMSTSPDVTPSVVSARIPNGRYLPMPFDLDDLAAALAQPPTPQV